MSDWKDNTIYIVVGRTMCGGAAMLGARSIPTWEDSVSTDVQGSLEKEI